MFRPQSVIIRGKIIGRPLGKGDKNAHSLTPQRVHFCRVYLCKVHIDCVHTAHFGLLVKLINKQWRSHGAVRALSCLRVYVCLTYKGDEEAHCQLLKESIDCA